VRHEISSILFATAKGVARKAVSKTFWIERSCRVRMVSVFGSSSVVVVVVVVSVVVVVRSVVVEVFVVVVVVVLFVDVVVVEVVPELSKVNKPIVMNNPPTPMMIMAKIAMNCVVL
jgi:hypothetical protein